MATPDVKVEAQLGSWVDITTSVRLVEGIEITRGRSDEAQFVDRGTCHFSLNNPDGQFSPNNPTGSYYGYLNRNARMRVSVADSTSRLECPSLADYLISPSLTGAHASTPDSAGLSVTGDIDLRADVDLWDWTSSMDLAGKWTPSPLSLSYQLSIGWGGAGKIRIAWSVDGTTILSASSTRAIPEPHYGRRAVRATLDVNNGAGGWTARFYTASTMAGTWVELGDPVTGAGVTSIYNGTQSALVGYRARMGSTYYAVQFYDGIAGTLRASPDFTAQSEAPASFVDSVGNTWTPTGGAKVTKRSMRFTGMMSEWPQKWDRSGRDVTTRMTCYGYLRSIADGATLRSPYYRAMTQLWTGGAVADRPVAYWPLEDGQGATTAATAAPNSQPMLITGTASFGSHSEFPASAPLPTMNGAAFFGAIPSHVATGTYRATALIGFPDSGIPDGTVLLRISTTGGTATRWDVIYNTGGLLTLAAYNSSGASVLSYGPAAFGVDGLNLRLQLLIVQDGADIDWQYGTLSPGASIGLSSSGTLAGRTIGTAKYAYLNPGRALTDTAMGHLVIQTSVGTFWDQSAALAAHANETAGARFLRLCDEEDIQGLVAGSSASSAPMGAQQIETLQGLLQACATTSGGVLLESRRFNGVVLQLPSSIYSQSPTATLAYMNLQDMSDSPDDMLVANDVTVSNPAGSTARSTLETGALSVQRPPNGIGSSSRSYSVNPAGDDLMKPLADWYLSQGTTSGPRFPLIDLNLQSSTFSAALADAVRAIDVTRGCVVTDAPAWVSFDDVSLVVQGMQESLSAVQHRFQLSCSPSAPWTVGEYDDGVSRYTTLGSTVKTATAAGVTTLPVYTPIGQGWAFTDGSYDLLVSGERVTASAASQVELLSNPTFEAGITGWTGVNSTLSASAVSHSGTGALLSTSGAGASPRADSNSYAVTAGETIVASAWIRVNTARSASLKVNWFDSASAFLSSTVVTTALAANTYTQFTCTATAPTSAAKASIGASEVGTPGAGLLLYLDDASLKGGTQNLTVTRAVNGVAKTLPAGATVELFRPIRHGL